MPAINRCCVNHCLNCNVPKRLQTGQEKLISIHRFPPDDPKKPRRVEQRQKWIEALKRAYPDWTIPRFPFVCSEHFREEDLYRFGQNVQIREGAVPSIFKQGDKTSQMRNYVIRHNRWVKLSTSGEEVVLKTNLATVTLEQNIKYSNQTHGNVEQNVQPSHQTPGNVERHYEHSYHTPGNIERHDEHCYHTSVNVEQHDEPSDQAFPEDPICSVDIKMEEWDPLETSEIFSENGGEDVAATNDEWQHENPTFKNVSEGLCFFDPKEETQMFSGDEDSGENTEQAGATVSTQVESPRQTHSTTADSQLRLCRTCGAQQHHLVDIYGNDGREKNLSEKINKHLPIKVCVEDCLPLSLCVTCVELLEACSLIRESSQLQDDLLRNNLIQQTSANAVSEEEQVSTAPPREEVSDNDQRESAETEPMVDKPGISGATKRSRTIEASKDSQPEMEGGKRKRKRKSRHTVEKEDYTNLSFAEIEEKLLVKIADNEKIVTSEDEPPLLCCDECEEIFEEEHLYRVHQKHHEIKKKMLRKTCNTCGETFFTYFLLSEHKNEKHPVVKINICEHCGKTFKRNDHLESHINYRHKPELPYMCHLCSKKFALFTDLKSHINNHDNTTCHVCDQTFKSYEHLKTHRYMVHSKKSKVNHAFVKGNGEGVYDRSKRIMYDTTPAQCPICKFTFTNQQFLELHIFLKHPDSPILQELKIRSHEKKFVCSDCGMSYTTKYILEIHMNTHTKEKIYKCKFCDKTSYHKLTIRGHEKSHKTERPHACTFCDLMFKRRYSLIVHIRTHTGEKPFKCHICTQAFAQLTDLKRHVARHNSNGPVRAPRKKLRCEDCGGTFASSKKLLEHHCRGGEGDSCVEDPVWHAQ